MRLDLPASYQGNIVGLLTDIEQLRVEPDLPAKVVIDEASGIIVMGADVRVSDRRHRARQSHHPRHRDAAGLPARALQRGRDDRRRRAPRSTVDDSADRKLTVVRAGVSLQQLVNGLNALGVGPRDMIAILQAIKAAGALQAEIEVM